MVAVSEGEGEKSNGIATGVEDLGKEQTGRLNSRAVAVFDLDGTLVVGQTQFLLVKFLRKIHVIGWAFVVGTALWFLLYKAGLVKVTEASRAKGAEVLRGLSEDEVEALMMRFAAEVLLPRLHPGVATALGEHQARGDAVVVVSAALWPLVAALCRHLGVTEYVGAGCEVVEGRYTGRLNTPVPYAAEKARVAAQLMAAHGADPANCWAYADHDSDLELLRSVGHPVAVNPRPGLLVEAKREGWPVLISPNSSP